MWEQQCKKPKKVVTVVEQNLIPVNRSRTPERTTVPSDNKVSRAKSIPKSSSITSNNTNVEVPKSNSSAASIIPSTIENTKTSNTTNEKHSTAVNLKDVKKVPETLPLPSSIEVNTNKKVTTTTDDNSNNNSTIKTNNSIVDSNSTQIKDKGKEKINETKKATEPEIIKKNTITIPDHNESKQITNDTNKKSKATIISNDTKVIPKETKVSDPKVPPKLDVPAPTITPVAIPSEQSVNHTLANLFEEDTNTLSKKHHDSGNDTISVSKPNTIPAIFQKLFRPEAPSVENNVITPTTTMSNNVPAVNINTTTSSGTITSVSPPVPPLSTTTTNVSSTTTSSTLSNNSDYEKRIELLEKELLILKSNQLLIESERDEAINRYTVALDTIQQLSTLLLRMSNPHN